MTQKQSYSIMTKSLMMLREQFWNDHFFPDCAFWSLLQALFRKLITTRVVTEFELCGLGLKIAKRMGKA